MDKQFLYAKNINEIFTILKNNPGTKVIGGCTGLENFPKKAISTRNVPDLCQTIRHERYITVGPGSTLAQILDLGENHLPSILYEAIQSIANPIIRNTATIGGNICSCFETGQYLTLYAPLMCLDAKLEIKSQNDTKSLNIRTCDEIPPNYILSNIKIPLTDADIAIFRRIGPEHTITPDSASFAFLARIERNALIGVELAFAGPIKFESNLNNFLIGKRLPLSQRDLIEIEEIVEKEFQEAALDQMIGDEVRQQFYNLVRYSFEQLA